jgi:hypothetical protein
VIRFTAIVSVVAVALGLLVAGAVSGTLVLVYLSIGVAGLALLLLVAGVLIWRDEVFGKVGPDRASNAAAQAGSQAQDSVSRDETRDARAGGLAALRSVPPEAVPPARSGMPAYAGAGRAENRPENAEHGRRDLAARQRTAGEDLSPDRGARREDLSPDRAARREDLGPERVERREERSGRAGRVGRLGRDDRAPASEPAASEPVIIYPAASGVARDAVSRQPDDQKPASPQPDPPRLAAATSAPAGAKAVPPGRTAPLSAQPEADSSALPGQLASPAASGRVAPARSASGGPPDTTPSPEPMPTLAASAPSAPAGRAAAGPASSTPRANGPSVAGGTASAATGSAGPGAPGGSARPTSQGPTGPARAGDGTTAAADASRAGAGAASVPAGAGTGAQSAPDDASIRTPGGANGGPSGTSRPAGTSADAPSSGTPSSGTPSSGTTPAAQPPTASRADTRPAASSSPAAARTRVTVVPGISRYHKADCILIRFLGDDDVETMPLGEAEEAGCVPCRACRPEKELADASQQP